MQRNLLCPSQVRRSRTSVASKPSPWNGEDEKAFTSWTEKFTMYMSNAGDKIWRNILKKIQSLSNDADLGDEKKVNTLLKSIGINPTVAEELQESLYDLLVQYTEGELLSDVQIAGLPQFQQLQEGLPGGKEEDCRKYLPRAQQGCRPAIEENMDELEEKFKKWKEDIAHLKDIDAYDYRDNGMISILLDFVPDEVRKEITMKYATVG